MPRQARVKSESETYHIMMRGINRQSIFEDEDDCRRFLDILLLCKQSCGFEIFAWCLMGNHVHLVMRFLDKPLDISMKKIEVAYAYYFNQKYEREGHLVQDRFRSEAIKDDVYLYTVVRYVHMNPVKAGICKNPEEYEWSSFGQYLFDGLISLDRPKAYIVDTGLLLDMHGAGEFIKFTLAANDDVCLDFVEPYGGRRMADEEAKEVMKRVTGFNTTMQFQALPFDRRRVEVRKLYDAKLNISQISRLTGISRGFIAMSIKGQE